MGLTAGEVAETSGFVIVTFTIGLLAVFPLIALLDPSSLDIIGISQPGGIAIGMLGSVLMAGYIGLGWWLHRPIRLFGYPLHLPQPRTAVAQSSFMRSFSATGCTSPVVRLVDSR